ncbi:unnamed protein product [Euphydryas editha]|uniref:Uncharacterized protein n=1 Tax=Euphydryas editha TaxID=104508 RepID=A0AAU9USR3_EUPED|nr:unnamed protein product [Euphydryas editha]
MATPPESPVEEHAYELEPSRTPKPIPVALEELCRQTKFSKQEIRVMYRGFKMNKIEMALHFEVQDKFDTKLPNSRWPLQTFALSAYPL